MYTRLAPWWGLLSPVEDYAEEASIFAGALVEHAPRAPRTVLELGAGGGHNAFHLKARFEMTLTDLSEDMLRQSRALNPELPHLVGDMRDLRLDQTFDAVFVHDAVTYLCTRAELRAAMETAFVHCRPGGVALFAPDETRERFQPRTEHGGSDAGERGLRFLEWSWDPDPDDETALTHYTFVLREGDEVEVVDELHVHGLFPRQVWLDTLEEVGFEARAQVYAHSELDEGYELFLGVKAR